MRRNATAIIITLVLGILAGPLVPDAQQATRVPRIGWLGGPTRESAEPFVQAFQRGLKDLGWVEGQNIVIEWRFAGGRAERLSDLAAELVRLQVDLIVVPSTPTALAAKNATKTIPLVMVAVGDPVGPGLVASLARDSDRPGGGGIRRDPVGGCLSMSFLPIMYAYVRSVSGGHHAQSSDPETEVLLC